VLELETQKAEPEKGLDRPGVRLEFEAELRISRSSIQHDDFQKINSRAA